MDGTLTAFAGELWIATGDKGEIRAALGQGIDGFFTDFPQIGVDTRNAYLRTR